MCILFSNIKTAKSLEYPEINAHLKEVSSITNEIKSIWFSSTKCYRLTPSIIQSQFRSTHL